MQYGLYIEERQFKLDNPVAMMSRRGTGKP
jgi:hypothetical protein